MIGKALRHPGSTRVLVAYLLGTGRGNEHVDARVVGSWRGEGVDASRPTVLAALLDAPIVGAGIPADSKAVYHLILASARGNESHGPDQALTDEQWSEIAQDALRRVGLIGNPGVGDDCRWVAVRHDEPGKEHAHIVATMVTENGRRVWGSNDRYRIGEACRAAEQRWGLQSTASGDRTGVPNAGRAEREKASRHGQSEPSRELLRRQVRQAITRASSSAGFLDELRTAGLLVNPRLSPSTGEVTGYAVAVAGGDRDSRGEPIFYGGGRLASDLTWPKVQARYGESAAVSGLVTAPETAARATSTTTATTSETRSSTSTSTASASARLNAGERQHAWRQARSAVQNAEHVIGQHDHDPSAAADVTWAASDFLAGVARIAAGSGHRPGRLAPAARHLDRAAREPWGRVPPPTPAGQGLRAASGLLQAARFVQTDESQQMLALLRQLVGLAEAVSAMRSAQGRGQQAGAAQLAGQELHTIAAAPIQDANAPGRAVSAARAAAAGGVDAWWSDTAARGPAAASAGVRR